MSVATPTATLISGLCVARFLTSSHKASSAEWKLIKLANSRIQETRVHSLFKCFSRWSADSINLSQSERVGNVNPFQLCDCLRENLSLRNRIPFCSQESAKWTSTERWGLALYSSRIEGSWPLPALNSLTVIPAPANE